MRELTASPREAARRLGVTKNALREAEQTSRIAREWDGSGTSTEPAAAWWRPQTPPARPWPPAPRAQPLPG